MVHVPLALAFATGRRWRRAVVGVVVDVGDVADVDDGPSRGRAHTRKVRMLSARSERASKLAL